jgi:ABC-type branched-subunit amino acid transport system permease subunit
MAGTCLLVRTARPAAAGAPWLFAEYWLAQLTFVLIYAIAGLGLMLLAGFTGSFPWATRPFWAWAPTRRRC